MLASSDAFPVVGGRCTGRTAGARPSRAVIARRRRRVGSYFHTSTVFGPRPNYFGNQQRSVTSSSRKVVIADVAGLLSLNLRGRSRRRSRGWMSGVRGIDEYSMARR
jgi:hypothetical protein